MARTAKGIATTATALPVIEMTSHVSSSRKFRLRSGPCGSLMPASLAGDGTCPARIHRGA